MAVKDKYSLYLNAFINAIDEYVKELNKCEQPDLTRVIFYGVQTVIRKPDPINYEEAQSDFQMLSMLKSMIASLTPREFMNMFPVSKQYDGDRYGIKDYYYTMDYINSINKDEPIGEKVLEFLMEYTNFTIDMFNVKGLTCVSDLRQYEGHLSLIEEFMASEGIETPNTFRNNRGQAMYVRNGKPTLVEGTKTYKLELVK